MGSISALHDGRGGASLLQRRRNFTVLENSWICFECISSYFVFYLKYLFNDLIYWNFNANRFMFYLQRAGVIRQELAKLKKQAAA